MTLIAAWRLSDCIVIHADSQETIVGDDAVEYRKTVQKIEPEQMGNYKVIIAGSGVTPSILSFIEKLRRALNANAAESLTDFVRIFEHELSAHYDSDPSLQSPSSEGVQFIVGVCCLRTGEYNGWITQNATLCPFGDHELTGHGEQLYRETIKRFISSDMKIPQAVLAGIYLLTLAEKTSNYVRSPFDIAIIRGNGIWMEPQKYIGLMQDRLKEYDALLGRLFLACADTSIHSSKLKELLGGFSEAAQALHMQHIDRTMERLTWEEIISTDDPYPRRPPGITTIFADGTGRYLHDPERERGVKARFEDARMWALGKPIIFRCRNCTGLYEYMLANPGKDTEPATLKCVDCGAENQVVGKVSKIQRVEKPGWINLAEPSA